MSAANPPTTPAPRELPETAGDVQRPARATDGEGDGSAAPAERSEGPRGAGEENFGRHLKQARIERGFTLGGLAQATGLSRSYLSNVEHNKNSPTISTLRTILDVLGVSLSQLFRGMEAEQRVLVREQDRRVIARTGENAVRYELLNPSPVGRLEMMLMEVAPGASSGTEPHTHAGEEVGLMISGELDYWVDGVRYRLRPGDAVNYDATLPHRYANPGTVPAVSVWTVTPPSF